MWNAIIQGAASGVLYGVLRYKNKALKAEEPGLKNRPVHFNVKKLSRTVLIGAILGAIAAYYGVGLELAYENVVLLGGATFVVEEVLKILSRWYKKYF